MKYLEIENGKCVGWTYPMYYGDALAFAEEVKSVCEEVSRGVGTEDTTAGKFKIDFINYKYKDGTRFILNYTRDGELAEIEAKDIYDDDYSVVYRNI